MVRLYSSVPCVNNCFNMMKAAVFVLEWHKGGMPINTANFTGDFVTGSKQLTLVYGTKNRHGLCDGKLRFLLVV